MDPDHTVPPLHYDKQRQLSSLTWISERGHTFWLLNAVGWAGISVVTYFSLSLPYSQFELSYLAHNVSQSLVGFLLTLPMRRGFKAIWDWPVGPRLVVALTLALVFAMIWSVLRLLLFLVMTDEVGLWRDFGGWLFPSIFVFVAWAALYHGIKYYQLLQVQREALLELESQQRQRALQLAQMRAQAQDAQLQLLRYQLNPHFLFNTLNSVTSLVTAGRTKDANAMLGRLSDFLRFSLEGGNDALVPLAHEIEAIQRYLLIEQVRFSDRMVIEFSTESDLDDLLVPSLLLQPLVENAIKYAIARSETGGTIRVAATSRGSRLHLSVSDSGSQRDSLQEDSIITAGGSPGIGLRNTRERLRNLFGEDFDLAITDSELGGLCFTVSLPATQSLKGGSS